jgi:hypothetical protein
MRRIAIALFVVGALVGCTQQTQTASSPPTTAADQAGVRAWLETNYGTKVWTGRVVGSRVDGSTVTILTDLSTGDSARALLICQNARGWWPQSSVPITKLKVVAVSGNTLLSDDGTLDGCS